jgi:hypothetical protein
MTMKKLVPDGTKIELEPSPENDSELYRKPDYSRGHWYIAIQEIDKPELEESKDDR